MLRDEEWKEVNSIMYKEGKVYVPKDDRLRAEIIRLHHNVTPYKLLGQLSDILNLN